MESPTPRIFGIDSSTVAISIGYTCTDNIESPLPNLFGEKSDSPMTIPMDRSRLLAKLRPSKVTNSDSKSTESERNSRSVDSLNHQESLAKLVSSSDGSRVEIRLSDFAAMMMDAAETNRTWVQDFSDDQIAVSTDLYEVMLAYRHMRRAG